MSQFTRTAALAIVVVAGLVWAAFAEAAPKESKGAAKKKKGTPAAAQSASPIEVPSADELIKRLKREHPRLLTDKAGLEKLRQRVTTDAVLRSWDEQVRREADRLLARPQAEYRIPDGLRLLATSRSVLERTYTLALAYRLHGDRRHAERLWKEMEAVAAFPDFNPKHFLDTAEMTHALAIAYDWLFDTWSESQKGTIRRAMVEMGLKPGLAVYEKGSGWARSTHNWNQVCNGGLTMGALAIGDEEPELAGKILRGALASVPLAMQSYAPDGAWGEGPGYWGYATAYNVVMLAGLQSALGSDFGLSGMGGFAETGLFPVYMTGPTGRAFNFEDSGERVGRADCLLWLARRFDRPVYAWFAAEARPTARSMLWYDKPGQDPAAAGLPLDKYWRGVEVAAMRSRWNDPQAVFLAMQAGSNRVNHNHLDLGSFVLDALGQRWAADLGGDDYNLPGYFGGQRYTYYRLRAEGHNTLVLNPGKGPDQDPAAVARIRRFDSQPDRAVAVADLTPAYAGHARRVERGIAMLQRRDVLVEDEVDAERPVDLWWFMHTAAGVTIGDDGRSATLEQGSAKLIARLLVPAEAKFEVRAAGPLATSPDPERQRRNDGTGKLTIHLPEAKSLRLAVLFTPVDGKADTARTPTIEPLANW